MNSQLRSSARKTGDIVTAAALVGVFAAVGAVLYADPHAGQSSSVVIIGGSELDLDPNCALSRSSGPSSGSPIPNTYANAFRRIGGSTACLPLTGYQSPTSGAGYEQFGFFPKLALSITSVADLALFDTAVLNVASWEISCDTANNITPAAKQALIDFVGLGKKLIIYDSECPGADPGSPTDTGAPSPVDYNWLPYGFTADSAGPTADPGGPFQIVEQNTLSTSKRRRDPHFIDENWIATKTDAAFDANVATTHDPHWCVDMTAQNNNNVTGPVHMYAHYPEGDGKDRTVGLFIWNGLNLDELNGEEQNDADAGSDYGLRKIWLQELEQPVSPSGLRCGLRAAPTTAGHMTGGGELGRVDGKKVHHTLHFDCDNRHAKLHIHWRKSKFRLDSSSVTCSDDPAISPDKNKKGKGAWFDTVTGSGTGTYNGEDATITFKFTDAGEPGRNDYAEYEIMSGGTTVFAASGNLEHGNHQAHRK